MLLESPGPNFITTGEWLPKPNQLRIQKTASTEHVPTLEKRKRILKNASREVICIINHNYVYIYICIYIYIYIYMLQLVYWIF